MFSWYGGTDPLNVVVELAWAWAKPDQQKICDMPGCPTEDGGYCLDCHGVAYSAQEGARRRLKMIQKVHTERLKMVAEARAVSEGWPPD
jgi:hypothetical protein